jgi:hypothetical protein
MRRAIGGAATTSTTTNYKGAGEGPAVERVVGIVALKNHLALDCELANYGRDDQALVNQHLRPLFEEARKRFNVLEP